ncbi:methionine adenosyltransferase [Actinoplanes sp. NPDC049316]|uniref:methionine adenosyltransferase n=1 Tax=Actinoplanes sp. NPDC049316 TaxID=3154727 RepID=UPI003430BE32
MRVLTGLGAVHPDQMPFDVAERKGIGHPDSLADLVADRFSQRYSYLCREQFGVVPNHWVDKVNLVGAAADVRFGGYDIRKPIDGYLFGKLTEHLGGTRLPLADLFAEVTRSVLVEVLGDETVLDHLRLHVNNTAGTAVDHDEQFYQPRTAAAVREVLADESVANDTVLCAGSGPRGAAAETAVWLESLLTRHDFRSRFGTGTDVKVMVVRSGVELDVTAAVPFLPGAVSTWSEYRDQLDAIQDELGNEVKQFLDGLSLSLGEARLHLNTKDVPGRGYLAPFGTSLGKGDCGAVGRGNRYNGVIEPLRPASGEAPAGKNPVHHVGKIYTAIAGDIAGRLFAQLGVYADVVVAARNGGRLDKPAYVLIRSDLPVGATGEAIAREALGTAPSYHERFLGEDPIARFRERASA